MFNFFGSRASVGAEAEVKKYARFEPTHRREATEPPRQKRRPEHPPKASELRTAQALARTKSPVSDAGWEAEGEPDISSTRLSGAMGGLSPAVLRAALPGRFQG